MARSLIVVAPLPHQLYALYTAERNLAFNLAGWFQQSTSIPVRLVLADLRRDGHAQCLRLERLIQSLTGAVASRVAANMITTMQQPSGVVARHEAGGASTRSIIAGALQTTRTTMSAYRSAITSARAGGDVTTAAMLAETLAEKREAAAVLTGLRRGPDGGRAEPARRAVASRQAVHHAVARGE